MKWINVKDRLPELIYNYQAGYKVSADVLIVVKYDKGDYVISASYCDNGKFIVEGDYEDEEYSDITCWMEMPKPPKK